MILQDKKKKPKPMIGSLKINQDNLNKNLQKILHELGTS